MKTILSLSFLVFFIGCSTWNKDNEETQYLNELVIEENSKNVVPLPLIKINSYSKEIVDEPKIPAEFQIFQENIILEEHNIGIEIRGSSSQFFDKKSYGFETWDENNEDLNVPLAGFPKEEDWILYGPYSDKSLVRNVLIYKLSNLMNRYAT